MMHKRNRFSVVFFCVVAVSAIAVADCGGGNLKATDIHPVTVKAFLEPSGLTFDGTSIWVASFGTNSVSKIDPKTNTVTYTVPVGLGPSEVTFDGASIWVANLGSNSVSKIDP